MEIRCPHCAKTFTLLRKHQIDHEVEIIEDCAEVFDTYVCPLCKGCVGVKHTSSEILDWFTEVELL